MPIAVLRIAARDRVGTRGCRRRGRRHGGCGRKRTATCPGRTRHALGRRARVAAAAAARSTTRKSSGGSADVAVGDRRLSLRWRGSASRSKDARSTTCESAPVPSACSCGRRCTATSRPRPRRCSTSSTTSAGIATSPAVERILSPLTLHVVPMLNPDGAERFQRRNAQSIDINRDALRLQTPEGQVLKALRDRLNPRVGFNLHNQSWRTSVGTPPKPASISLLSVAYDEARTRERRPKADQADLRRDPRRARAVRVRPDRPLRRRVRGPRVRRQHHALGNPGGPDRDRAVAVGRARPGARPPQLRRASCRRSTRWRPARSTRRIPKRYEDLADERVEGLLRARQERDGHQRQRASHRSPPTSVSLPAGACRSPTAGGNCRRR